MKIQFGSVCDEEIFRAFKKRCKGDGILMSQAFEALMHLYSEGFVTLEASVSVKMDNEKSDGNKKTVDNPGAESYNPT